MRATYGPCPDPNQPGACDDKVEHPQNFYPIFIATHLVALFFPLIFSQQPDRVSVLNVATKANGDLDTILGCVFFVRNLISKLFFSVRDDGRHNRMIPHRSAYVPDPEYPGELLVQFPGSKY